MLKLFRRKNVDMLVAPCHGTLIQLEDVKDPMFAQKLLGDGFAIEPKDDVICAPCDGEISMIANTKHAIGITSSIGAEILIHVGLDTVNLQGKGFTVLAKLHQKVKKGMPILKLDIPFLNQCELDLTIPVVVTNSSDYSFNQTIEKGETNCAQEILSITKS